MKKHTEELEDLITREVSKDITVFIKAQEKGLRLSGSRAGPRKRLGGRNVRGLGPLKVEPRVGHWYWGGGWGC